MILEVAGDGRFEIIAKAKKALIDSTNIETSEDEMKVLDNFLFRCWQMGWLDKYDDTKGERAEQTDEKISIDEIKDYVHSVFKSAEEFTNPITESPNDVIESENDVIEDKGGDADMGKAPEPVPIPLYMQECRPHGRLIDADALKGAFMDELFEKSGKSVQQIIDNAPTVEIPLQHYVTLGEDSTIEPLRPHGEWVDGWEVIRELSETRCMYNCFDENDRPMYEAMTSAIDIVRQMMGGADMRGDTDDK